MLVKSVVMHPLDQSLITFLLSLPAQTVLAELAEQDLSQAALLPLLMRLRNDFSREKAAVLVDQARLRRKGMEKFPDANKLLFIDEALEQASSLAAASYRAARMRDSGSVCDLGCGIGADSIAFARAGCQVLAVERDPLRARIAAANYRTLGLDGLIKVICADWSKLVLPQWDVFIDPSRRVKGRRVYRLDKMDPPLLDILPLLDCASGLAVKVSPGVDHSEIPKEAEVSFLSEKGEMKEAVLWFGVLKNGVQRQAVLLPGPFTLNSDMAESKEEPRLPGKFLYEPDPSVLRAGLVRHLARHIGGQMIDPEIAYLTADDHIYSPFIRGWRVIRHGRFHLKTLNQWLRIEGVGHVTLKKRGSPIDVDTFIKRLKTDDSGEAYTVFLTHALGKPWMLLARKVSSGF